MKERLSIEFIRFSHQAEGFGFSVADLDAIKDILDGRLGADGIIQDYIERHGLSTDYTPEEGGDYYPDTHCLVNYFSLKNRQDLKEIESLFSCYRAAEILAENHQPPFEFDTLLDLHARLFGDVYPSAGQLRSMDIKRRTVFCDPRYIRQEGEKLFLRIQNAHYLRGLDKEKFVNELAYFMGEMEALHPFNDGNGRVERLFFYVMALYSGYQTDWGMADPDRLLEADICAIDGDYQLLISVLTEIINPAE